MTQPKVGDVVWFGHSGYSSPAEGPTAAALAFMPPGEGYESRLVPHPAIVVKVHDPGNPQSRLGLVVFCGNEGPSPSRSEADVPYSQTLEVGAWSARE